VTLSPSPLIKNRQVRQFVVIDGEHADDDLVKYGLNRPMTLMHREAVTENVCRTGCDGLNIAKRLSFSGHYEN
jgi:hypothetical protein